MQRIFAADIGGTNARFALFTVYEGNLTLMSAVWAKSADLGNLHSLRVIPSSLPLPGL